MNQHSRKSTSTLKRKPFSSTKEPAPITPVPPIEKEPINISLALQAKYNLLQLKTKECENLEAIAKSSQDSRDTISAYCDSIVDLSTAMQGIADTLINWDAVFSVMGETNVGQDLSSGTWVRVGRSCASETILNNKEQE